MSSPLDQRPMSLVSAATIAPLCVFAALAPYNPSPVLNRGAWVSAAVIVVCLHQWRPGLPDVLALSVGAWAWAAALGSPLPSVSGLAVGNYWACALLFVATRARLRTVGAVAAVGWAYLAGTVWTAAQILTVDDTQYASADVVARVGIDGVNPNYTAYALATGVLVAVMLLKQAAGKGASRLLLWLAIPVLVFAVEKTGTRGAVVALVLAGTYLLACRFTRRPPWRVAVTPTVVLLFAIPLGLYGDGRLLWVQAFFDRDSADLSGRLAIWPMARDVWLSAPWTGVGPGVFPVTNPLGIGAHSLLLALGTDLGVAGAGLYLATFAVALVVTARAGDTGRLLTGLLLVCWLPIWLSGHWEVSPAAWLILAVWSRLPLALRDRGDAQRHLRRESDANPRGPCGRQAGLTGQEQAVEVGGERR